MSDPKTQAPTRLLDDPALDSVLRQDLELVADNPAIAFDVDAGLARFEQSLASSAAAAPGTRAATAGKLLGWVVGATVLLGGSVGAAWVLGEHDNEHVRAAVVPIEDLRTEDEPVAGQPPSDASTGPRGSRERESVAEVGVRDGAGDAGAALALAEGGSPALDASTPPRPTSKPDPDDADTGPADAGSSLADEARQINAIRKALDSDPAGALALVEATKQQFPNGAMVHERRGYEILALVALGRMDEARSRADSYLRRWPQGPLSRRVRSATAP